MNRRHLHLQALGGIAGDMFVAAMLDAFPGFAEQVFRDVAAVLPPEAGRATMERVSRNAIAAAHFSLRDADDSVPRAGRNGHERDDAAAPRRYRPAGRRPDGMLSPAGADPAACGDYAAIRARIEAAGLSEATAGHALGILEILARAESRIHGVPLEAVHFHEIAGFDSLMDVVAAASVIAAIAPASWSTESLPLGTGRVGTRHGLLPVPAPATALMLEGYPWHADGVAGERVTPTGAAILRYLVPPEHCRRNPAGTLVASGYGAGTKQFPGMANVLRVLAFEPVAEDAKEAVEVLALEFDIDDMTGEEIGIAASRLRELDGILDLVLVPGQGKKGRPVTTFRLQVSPDRLAACGEAIFQETSTIGIRYATMRRMVLERRHRRSPEGLRIKEVVRPAGLTTRKVESDDLAPAGDLFARRQRMKKAEESR